jgi:uncharacterized repeat protein (TIGR03806 family)
VKRWLGVLLLSCGSKQEPAQPARACEPPPAGFDLTTAESKYSKLSDVCVYDETGKPRAGWLQYELTTPLFSDDTIKARYVWMPKGSRAKYSEDKSFEFPVGTIIAKTFSTAPDMRKPSEGQKRIETRLMIRTATEWVALPYIWNADQKDATLQITGEIRPLTFTRANGETVSANYLVPTSLQCKKCHEDSSKKLQVIGPKARLLNRDDQLNKWKSFGYLDQVPATPPKLVAWDDTSQSIDARARAYLEVNCAHCHDADGTARTSGLYLMATEKDPYKLGVCKTPVAAGGGSGGLLYSIVPGCPDESIFTYRMASLKTDEMMPELGRSIVHTEGLALIRQWISEMPKASCSPATCK